MTVIFKAKTQDGYTIKILSELLQNTIKTACFRVTSEGIFLRMMDSQRRILIDIVLHKDKFNIFDLKVGPMDLGICLNHLYKMLKSVKKKDALMMCIDDVRPHQLCLLVYPKENNRVSKSSVHIQSIQNVTISLPTGYSSGILIPASEYQSTLKGMDNISNIIYIAMKQYSMSLSCSADNVYSREVQFGEIDDTTCEIYRDEFDMEQFIRIVKIAGLGTNLHVHAGAAQRPLLITSNIGELGTIQVFIKSRTQMNN
jgi:DNA polymerase III sliding clamp (beta) subunit (PCNA family)